MIKKTIDLLDGGQIFKLNKTGIEYLCLDEWKGNFMSFRKCVNMKNYKTTTFSEDRIILVKKTNGFKS
jgi:hypothetical protein